MGEAQADGEETVTTPPPGRVEWRPGQLSAQPVTDGWRGCGSPAPRAPGVHHSGAGSAYLSLFSGSSR